jgi:phospholipid/cholesterol/gamma-HCH transport system substrate-binding protein
MSASTKREIAVGGLALAGLVLFFAGTMYLKGAAFTTGDRWTVLFTDVNGLKNGSPVQVSGFAVGHVTKIELRKPGEVAVTFALPDDMPLRSDAVVQVASVGLVGDVLLKVDPGTSPTVLDPGQPIIGSAQSPGFAAQAEGLSQEVSKVTAGAALILNQETADGIHRSLRALERMLNTYGNPDQGPAAQLTRTMGEVELLTAELRRTITSAETSRLLANADTLTGNLARATRRADELANQLIHTSAVLDSMLARVNRGEGTLGMLATDSGLYHDARRTSQALTELLEEIKRNPGRLTIQFKMF